MDDLIKELGLGIQKLGPLQDRMDQTHFNYEGQSPISISVSDIEVSDEITELIRKRREESDKVHPLSFGTY